MKACFHSMEQNHQDVEFPGAELPEPPPASWVSAIMELLATRVSLMEIEGCEAAKSSAKKLFLIIAATIAASLTWVLLVAALIGLVCHFSKMEWFWVTGITALLHGIGAGLMLRSAKPSGAPSFPLTRAEFAKDRLWIESLSQNTKSGN